MDISINVGYFGPHISEDKDLIKKLDDIGVSCVWTAEAYGFDAVTPLAYFSALTEKMNHPSRSRNALILHRPHNHDRVL